MRARVSLMLSLLLGALHLSGCGKQPPAPAPAALSPPAPAAAPEEKEPDTSDIRSLREAIATADSSLKSGAFDDAAAQLLKARMAGKEFSPQDAAAYRRTLSEAYSRALEAAEKGDPKAQAAVQMIRAAGRH